MNNIQKKQTKEYRTICILVLKTEKVYKDEKYPGNPTFLGSVSNVGVDKKEKSCNKFKNFQFKQIKQIKFSFLTYQNVGNHKKFFSRL